MFLPVKLQYQSHFDQNEHPLLLKMKNSLDFPILLTVHLHFSLESFGFKKVCPFRKILLS